jgi:hypothetical protein
MSAAGRSLSVRCRVDIGQTPESLHAHVQLDGCDVGPGDSVLVHDAPGTITFGDQLTCERDATVVRAGWLRRHWTRLAGALGIAELIEVGF